jgi:hypothetical protein
MFIGTRFTFLHSPIGKEGLKRNLENEAFLREESQKAFARFTKEQASAICKWLEHARTWPEMNWYLEDVDSALDYWQKRR